MNKINATNARQNFYNILANTSVGDPLLITAKTGNCILISEAEWNSVVETAYVMSNPKIREDIINGLKTPLDECVETLPW